MMVTFSQIYLTGIASKNGEKVAFIKTSEGTFHYQEGEIIGSGFILLNIDDKNLTIQISNDIPITNDTQIRSIKLIEDEK